MNARIRPWTAAPEDARTDWVVTTACASLARNWMLMEEHALVRMMENA